uniref:Insulin-induced gene 1 protein n=1 Tax=Chromera velia CCMP2878 TaxID=1169474 RepID=A0A0G4HPJ1_9ALVE|eukprot:Cvel_29817.t1-p1 / transcript=Cvel_29817.t1 / gene=Cvel_29817 / organism=Chromera_velia_CCMP2878 / gene_product=hypothetical protein / transcript_product=hypothetical protein / location=Cvel_scaffold4152:9014-10887(+) / protein_length=315 / sequence_SO=supercontig / SO=protein_coding / is_pseudo=false
MLRGLALLYFIGETESGRASAVSSFQNHGSIPAVARSTRRGRERQTHGTVQLISKEKRFEIQRGKSPFQSLLERGAKESETDSPQSGFGPDAELKVENLWRLLFPLALSGALLGPVLDGSHGNFNVLHYDRFVVPVGLPEGPKLFETALWVPPLFGLAGIIIGLGTVVLDSVLKSPDDARRPGNLKVLSGVLLYCAQYVVSGFLFSAGVMGSGPALFLLLSVLGFGLWYALDRTVAGICMSLLTSVCGPLIEVGLISLSEKAGAPLYHYTQPDIAGVSSWIIPVYFGGGPAVGNLGRLFANRLGVYKLDDGLREC